MFTEQLEPRRFLAAALFTYDPPASTQNPHSLRFDLDLPTVPTGTLLSLTNLNTGESITAPVMATGSWPGGASAIFTFPGYSNGVTSGILPDGNYYAVIVDQDQPAEQQILLDTEFFVFAGDANHDRVVNIRDLSALATNWQGTGKTFSQGDFNYDGVVDAADLGILATKWQQTMPEPTFGIRLTGTAVSSDGIDKWWTSYPGAAEYRLELSQDGTDFFESAPLDTSSTAAFSRDLAPDRVSYFRVVATDGTNDLAVSNIAHARTFAAEGIPILTEPVESETDPVTPRSNGILLVAFNGLYLNDPLESDGNRWFEWMVRENGNSIKPAGASQRSYNHHTSEMDQALGDLLPRIDTNNDLIITAAEANASKVVIMAHSWGGIPAGKMAIKLKQDNITVPQGGGFALYHMEGGVDIPVKLLLTLDVVHSGPARVVRWIDGKIDTNVQTFKNWYQRRGGTVTFGLWPAGTTGNGTTFNPFTQVGTYTSGTTFSSILKGTTLPHQLAPANVSQVNLNTLGARYASNVDWVQNPLTGVNHFDANLQASGVEHLALPWYVHGGVGGGFSQDYNVLQELANVEAGSLVAPTAVGDDAVRMPLSGTSVRQYILDARDLDWNGSYDRDDDTGRSAAESLSDSILD